MISEMISRIQTDQSELSSIRTSFIRYKNLFRDLRMRAPSFDDYGTGIGINDLTRTRIESESLNEQVSGKIPFEHSINDTLTGSLHFNRQINLQC